LVASGAASCPPAWTACFAPVDETAVVLVDPAAPTASSVSS
jgi:hypothetical protein